MTLHGNHQVLYASCESNGGELIGIDLRTKRVEVSVKLGVPHPHSVTVPSLNNACTANKDAGHISVCLTNKRVTQIPTPSRTEGIISDGKYVFAGNQTRSELLVVDPKNDKIVKR